MEEVYKETFCFTVDKYLLSKIKDNEEYKEFIIKELSNNLADYLVDILSSEGEILVSMSDVRCQDNNDFATVDYRQYLKWSHLVRCKDCKYRDKYDCNNLTFGDIKFGVPDDWFCADGKRKEGGAE